MVRGPESPRPVTTRLPRWKWTDDGRGFSADDEAWSGSRKRPPGVPDGTRTVGSFLVKWTRQSHSTAREWRVAKNRESQFGCIATKQKIGDTHAALSVLSLDVSNIQD